MSDLRKAAIKRHLEISREKLLTTLARVDDWDLTVQAEGDQWTAGQMVRHLMDAHAGMLGQVGRILEDKQTVPPDFDINRWNKRQQQKLAELSPEEAIEKLQASHQQLLELVDQLEAADFEKSGLQAGLQQVLPLEKFIMVMGSHEAAHADEIAAALEG